MELFTHCPSCHNTCAGEVAYVQGTFIAVRQHCSHCEHQRQWTSQPRIKDTPAGNVLLSAAILFSGATPGKVIRMLSHMKVACFTDRTLITDRHNQISKFVGKQFPAIEHRYDVRMAYF